ncbi:MAG: flavin reductase family protein [Candidatus Cloacimonadaceae bacterium]|nr:flavin reductase family protein [Candidatus Cloacimonadaceae bacterium]
MLKTCDYSDVNSLVHLPAKVVLAVSETPAGSYNLITLEWFMRTSIAPPMFAISIGHSRFSHDCFESKRFFNLVFPSDEQKSLLSLCGSTSGRDTDKFSLGDVNSIPGKLQKLPVLVDAVANLECEIVTQVRSGDHTIYVGQVHFAWINKEKNLFYYPRS